MAGVLDSSGEGEQLEQMQNPMPRHSVAIPADLQASSGILLALGTCEDEIYVGFLLYFDLNFVVCFLLALFVGRRTAEWCGRDWGGGGYKPGNKQPLLSFVACPPL